MKQSELKKIIKQCFLEMIDDGEISLHINTHRASITEDAPIRKRRLAVVSPAPQSRRVVANSALDSIVQSVASNNPVLAEIVADTGGKMIARSQRDGDDDDDGSGGAGIDISGLDMSKKWGKILDLVEKKSAGS